jgi:predicted metal-dependent HD superfamily phosphohydrolase
MKVSMKDRLKREFTALWLAVADDAPANAARVFEALVDHYAEPGRHYHNLDHVNHCLEQVRLVEGLIPQVHAIKLAIWFHDSVYDPLATDNEAESAAFFRDLAGRVMSAHVVDDVTRLIMVTKSGRVPDRADEAFMIDIDYSSFGLPWEPFLADSLAVRAERPHLTDEQYSVQQSRMLTGLLHRDVVFRTDVFRARYEDGARSNIGRYLDLIARRSAGT